MVTAGTIGHKTKYYRIVTHGIKYLNIQESILILISYVAEFQIIYGDPPSSRLGAYTLHPFKCGLCTVTSFQRKQSGKGRGWGEGGGQFPHGEPDIHSLGQLSYDVNVDSDVLTVCTLDGR